MSLEDITLPTNKSETRVSNNRRTIRSGEKGLAIKVALVDANDQPYDLSAFTLEFNEIKDQGKIVFDSGSGDNSGAFKIVDAKGGVFTYTLAPQVYSASGRAWFVVKQGDTIIDTTKDFYFDVLQDATIHIDNDNYVSSMETELDAFKAMTQREQQNADNLIKSLTDQMNQAIADGNTKEANALADEKTELQALHDATSKLNDDWTTELNTQKQNFTTLQSQWQAQTTKIDSDYATQKKSIQDAADKQLADNKTADQAAIDKVNADRDSAIKDLNDKRDAAIATANTNFQNKISDLQTDYDDWKTKTVSDFTSKVSDLENRVTAAGTKQTELEAAIKSAQDAVSKIKDVDFTQYVTKTDLNNYYTKAEMDPKLAAAGKLKTISVNDATPISPDDQGNINLANFAKSINVLMNYDIQNNNTGSNSNWTKASFDQNGAFPYGLIDPDALKPFAEEINKLNGNAEELSNPDLNTLTETGIYHLIDMPQTIDSTKNNPSPNWGILVVLRSKNGTRIVQIFIPDDPSAAPFIRPYYVNWQRWYQLASTTNLTNLQSTIQKSVASLSDNVATDEGKISDNTKNISTNTQDISTLQGQQTQTAADVASIKKAVGSGAIAQVKQYTEEQEVQALKDSASGNVLGVFFS